MPGYDDFQQKALGEQLAETQERLARAGELAAVVVTLFQSLKVGGFPDDVAIEMARDYFEALIQFSGEVEDEDD